MSSYPPAIIGRRYSSITAAGAGSGSSFADLASDRADGVLKAGIVYSTGCEIGYETESQKELVRDIIRNDCAPAATPGSGH
jgi:hypothetical protein